MNYFNFGAVALAASMSAPAMAQSNVALYGMVDLSTEYVQGVANGTTGTASSVKRLVSGANNQSRWGLRGSEDLGDGLSALFNLESGFNADDGSLVGGLGFSRMAVVGMQGSLGKFLAGHQLTTINSEGQFDPLGYWRMGSKTLIHGANAFIRDNQIRLFSPVVNGFSAGGHIIAKEGAPGSTGGYGVEAGYDSPAFAVRAIIEDDRDPATGQNDSIYNFPKQRFLGGRYNFGQGSSVVAGVEKLDATNDTKVAKSAKYYWLGVRYQTPGLWLLYGGVYRINMVTSAKSTLLALGAEYPFSRRTSFYINAGQIANSGGATASVTPTDSSLPNARNLGADVGLIHKF